MATKILSAQQTKRMDEWTMQHEPISSLALMERASQECTDALLPYLSLEHPAFVFCGSGNNGGDGFAIARLLRDIGFPVSIFYVPFGAPTAECQANRARVSDVQPLTQLADLPALTPNSIIIDALLGIGTSRAPEGMLGEVIGAINASGAQVLAVDIPSGLPADSLPGWETVVKANVTITFQQPKLAFFLPETAHFSGRWQVVPIGLDKGAIAAEPSRYYHLDANSIAAEVRVRERFSHKGTYGHGLLVAGSAGKMGAAVLSSKAALRSGMGLLTVHVPAYGRDVLQISVPEAMCMTDQETTAVSHIDAALETYSAIGIGPGIGKAAGALAVLRQLLESGKQLVIDADALNLLAENPELLEHLPPETVLTPHPKEFERLAGPSASGMDRLERLVHFAQTYRCVVILKDAITAVATPAGNVYFNTTGNPGMATGGSGDVLTGIVLGLRAQGYPAATAAQLAVFFHGKAGDIAAAKRGEAALIASDLVRYLRIEREA